MPLMALEFTKIIPITTITILANLETLIIWEILIPYKATQNHNHHIIMIQFSRAYKLHLIMQIWLNYVNLRLLMWNLWRILILEDINLFLHLQIMLESKISTILLTQDFLRFIIVVVVLQVMLWIVSWKIKIWDNHSNSKELENRAFSLLMNLHVWIKVEIKAFYVIVPIFN